MGFHTYDPSRADALEDVERFAFLSVEELLGLVDATPADRLLDVGSGTGFYTDELASAVETAYALDVQQEMHALYGENGVPANVHRITGDADTLPLRSASIDAVVSTMTYHEFATADALAELARVLEPGGRVGIGDWTRSGTGERGPPVDERYDAATAADHFRDAGFGVLRATDRRETFVLAARNE